MCYQNPQRALVFLNTTCAVLRGDKRQGTAFGITCELPPRTGRGAAVLDIVWFTDTKTSTKRRARFYDNSPWWRKKKEEKTAQWRPNQPSEVQASTPLAASMQRHTSFYNRFPPSPARDVLTIVCTNTTNCCYNISAAATAISAVPTTRTRKATHAMRSPRSPLNTFPRADGNSKKQNRTNFDNIH